MSVCFNCNCFVEDKDVCLITSSISGHKSDVGVFQAAASLKTKMSLVTRPVSVCFRLRHGQSCLPNHKSNFCVSGNGFIEGKELDQFLYELVTSINTTDLGPEVSTRSVNPHPTPFTLHPVSLTLCTLLSLLLSVSVFVPVSLSLSVSPLPPSLCLSVCLCLSLYLSLCLFLCLSLSLFVCLSASASVSLCLSVSLSLCLSVSPLLLSFFFVYFCPFFFSFYLFMQSWFEFTFLLLSEFCFVCLLISVLPPPSSLLLLCLVVPLSCVFSLSSHPLLSVDVKIGLLT